MSDTSYDTDEQSEDNPLMFGTGRDRESLDELLDTFTKFSETVEVPLVDVLAAYVAAADCWVTATMDFAASTVREEIGMGHLTILVNLGADPEKLGLVRVEDEAEVVSAGSGRMIADLSVD